MAAENTVEEIIGLHRKLATRFKEYETTDGDLPPIVVLNEMRYALRAAMKLLAQASFSHVESSDDEQTLHVAFQETSHALRNAYHDLVDGILIQISRIMDDLLDRYPVATANVLSERRLAILSDINEVENHVARSRGDGLKRQEIYDVEIYDRWFANIVEHYRFIDQVALPEIIREDDRIKQKETSARRKFWLTVILSILGLFLSLLTIILAL